MMSDGIQMGIWQRCLPELTLIVLCVAFLWVLLRFSGVRLSLGHLRRLHADQVGGIQSLSFVLTVPLFIFVMMFIVQLSQLTIAKVVVEYAAYSAARSAVVWIPAGTELIDEGPNRISFRQEIDRERIVGNDEYWLDDERPLDVAGPRDWGDQQVTVYRIQEGSPKYEKIKLAAVMACVSISPSRRVSEQTSAQADLAAEAALKAYRMAAPSSVENPRIPDRLRNKIAYAMANTEIDIQVRHKDSEVPLWILKTPLNDGFYYNEIGWQDQIEVTVTHQFALLPGPGRLLARRADARPGTEVDESYAGGGPRDSIAQQIGQRDDTYVYTLTSTARLPNEGHIPRYVLVQRLRNR